MKQVFWISLFMLVAGVFTNARADQFVIKWGFEKNILAEGAGNGERTYGLEYYYPLGASSMFLKAEVGGWIARQADRKSSPYVSAQWGYRAINRCGLFFEAFVGPGYVRTLDSRLSSHGEIFHDVNMGFLACDGWGISGGFKHISNAGFVPPNRGRDFGSVRFVIPL